MNDYNGKDNLRSTLKTRRCTSLMQLAHFPALLIQHSLMTSRNQKLYTGMVLLVGTGLFVRSAYTVLSVMIRAPPSQRRSRQRPISASASSTASSSAGPAYKLVSESAVSNITYTATIEDCTLHTLEATPKLSAGSLLKLIDIAAGVVARRHAGMPAVTVSVDSVLFLAPIYLGDLIHISASVNRAWGTSMEIGVRVMKSDERSTTPEYVGHSYLTFVAINKRPGVVPNTDSSFSSRIWSYLGWHEEMKPAKVVLPAVRSSSRLEARRHLLAGRRRKKRIEDTQKGEARDMVSLEVKRQVRQQVLEMLYERDAGDLKASTSEQNARMENRLRAIEIEYLIRAWAHQEDGVSVKSGRVVIEQPGDESFDYSEHEIRATAALLGVKLPGDEQYTAGRRLSSDFLDPSRLPSTKSSLPVPPSSIPSSTDSPKTISATAVDTLTTTYALIFPEHTNSQGLIFGGNTMSWSEQVALMACRNINISGSKKRANWKTVAMDGLEFNVRVSVGE
jgi:acyl-CoA hydrolase